MLQFRPVVMNHFSGAPKTAAELDQAMRRIVAAPPIRPAALTPPPSHTKVAGLVKTAEEVEFTLIEKLASSPRGFAMIKVADAYGRLMAQLETANTAGEQAGIKTAEENLADFVTVTGPNILMAAKFATHHKKHESKAEVKEERAEERAEHAPEPGHGPTNQPPMHAEAKTASDFLGALLRVA